MSLEGWKLSRETLSEFEQEIASQRDVVLSCLVRVGRRSLRFCRIIYTHFKFAVSTTRLSGSTILDLESLLAGGLLRESKILGLDRFSTSFAPSSAPSIAPVSPHSADRGCGNHQALDWREDDLSARLPARLPVLRVFTACLQSTAGTPPHPGPVLQSWESSRDSLAGRGPGSLSRARAEV
eukprot:3940635-Rhodomonas_salina.1